MTTVNDQPESRILDVEQAWIAALAEDIHRQVRDLPGVYPGESGSPYPAALTGPDCGCPVYYAVTRCQHGEYACNLCNVEHAFSCPKMPKAQVVPADAVLPDLSTDDTERAATIDPAEMLGERVSVEHVGLPSPDAHAVAARVEPELETLVRNTIYMVEQSTIGRRFAARQIINTVREHDASAPRWTPWLPLSAGEVERLLCDTSRVRMQAQDTGDETTPHPLSVGDCDGDGCDAELEERSHLDEFREADEAMPRCVLLISVAFPGGVLHCPSVEAVTVRIGGQA